MRGKRPCGFCAEVQRRITPACAGKTAVSAHTPLARADHPRVCGENRLSCRTSTTQSGSPPRVRGKLSHIHTEIAANRITPACAGKTQAKNLKSLENSDHPRVCGENFLAIKHFFGGDGSPPRVRGKLVLFWQGCFPERITPACAGKTI